MTALTLHDLDDRARLGIRGSELARWLDPNGYGVGTTPNIAYPQSDGSLLARLSATELVWLGTADQSIDERIHIAEDYRCYTVSRRDSHTWFRLTGTAAPQMIAKICGVNMCDTVFANHTVAQTSVARISAIVIRDDDERTSFHLLADSSYARYLGTVLVDAGNEYSLPNEA